VDDHQGEQGLPVGGVEMRADHAPKSLASLLDGNIDRNVPLEIIQGFLECRLHFGDLNLPAGHASGERSIDREKQVLETLH